ncbi:O-antigen ligase family protein [Ferriphaselus sp. R-1]|uniref:O-antigen ligase family protein n=1 Tax=Ferriphaselus sp. R-1 TaxID=1485544 RepID=UPI0009DE1667|nr:O-antigen ligase family protein [Ferriphaselus sp. R-1]
MTRSTSRRSKGAGQVWALLAIFVFMPLPLASNRTWALALLALLVSGLAVWHLWSAGPSWWQRESDVFRRARVPAWLMVGWLVLLAMQLLPLSNAVRSGLVHDPMAGFPVVQGEMAPLSVDVYSTRIYLVRAWVLALLMWLVFRLIDRRQRFEWLVKALLFSGVLQALLAVVLFAAGAHYSLFFVDVEHGFRAKGTFVYHNHFAGYMEMILAIGIGLMIGKLDGARVEGWRGKARSWLALLVSSKAVLRMMLIVMVIGLIASRSRMGNSAFFVSLLLVGGLAWLAFRHIGERTNMMRALMLFIASVVVLDVVIVGGVVGIEKVMHRIEATNLRVLEKEEAERVSTRVSGDVVEGRSPIGYREESLEERVGPGVRALDMVRDFPVLGTGGGTFHLAYFPYRPQDVNGYYDHAHDDFIEFAAEVGLLGVLVLVVLVGHSVYRSFRLLLDKSQEQFVQGMAFASLMGVVELLIHSSVDFNLQNLTNAALFLVVLSLPYLIQGWPQHERLARHSLDERVPSRYNRSRSSILILKGES